MRATPLPVLEELKALYARPRGLDRFRAYLDRMTQGSGDVVLPIVAANPMAKTKAPEMVQRLLAMEGEAVVAKACLEAERRLSSVEDAVRVSLVVADDMEGVWSDPDRMMAGFVLEDKGGSRRGFAQVVVWTSEEPTVEEIRRRTFASVYRVLHIRRHGLPRTLRDALLQEARVLRFVGVDPSAREPHGADRLGTFLEATDFPTLFAVLFGDAAAIRFGYDARGFERGAAAYMYAATLGRNEEPVAALREGGPSSGPAPERRGKPEDRQGR